MDFELNEDQKMLAETVASFVKQTSPIERFRKMREDARGYDPAVWKQMGELGWLSVPFPESVGGFEGSFVDVAVVLEKLGTTLVPEPYIASVVLAGMAILRGGAADAHERFLKPMIEGRTTLALAYAERQNRHDATTVRTTAIKEGNGWKITGEKIFVLNGHAADHIVVSAKLGDGIGLFVLDRETPHLTITPIKLIDGTRGAMLRLEGAVIGDDRRLNDPGRGAAILDHVLDYGAAAACAEGLGVIDTMLSLTVAYMKERKQFDVPIGSFQVLQHRAVDMFVQTQLCRATNALACIRVDESDASERHADVSAAKVQLATGGRFVAQQSIQLFGGVGITDEYDIGLYFKRMQALNALFGDEEHHVQRFMHDASFTAV